MKSRILLLSFLLMLTILFSCENDNLSLAEDKLSETHLQSLSFENAKGMLNYFNSSVGSKTTNLNNVEGVKIENGFISFDQIYSKAVNELVEAQSIEEHDMILSQYSDILKLSDNGDEYIPKIRSAFYRSICNREGVYFTEGFAHKVIGNDYLVVTEIKNLSQLRDLESIVSLDESIFKVFNYSGVDNSISGRTKTDCGSYLSAEYIDDPSGCKNDRKVIVEASTTFAVTGSIFTPVVFCQSKGMIKSGVFCRWKDYSTQLTSNPSFFRVQTNLTLPGAINVDAKSSNGDSQTLLIYSGTVGDSFNWQIPLATPTVTFTGISVQAGSRGIGSNFAVLNCF